MTEPMRVHILNPCPVANRADCPVYSAFGVKAGRTRLAKKQGFKLIIPLGKVFFNTFRREFIDIACPVLIAFSVPDPHLVSTEINIAYCKVRKLDAPQTG